MGNILSHIYEEENDQLFVNQEKYLDKISSSIKEIRPNTTEFYDFEWLWKNKDKIIKQKALINLIK